MEDENQEDCLISIRGYQRQAEHQSDDRRPEYRESQTSLGTILPAYRMEPKRLFGLFHSLDDTSDDHGGHPASSSSSVGRGNTPDAENKDQQFKYRIAPHPDKYSEGEDPPKRFPSMPLPCDVDIAQDAIESGSHLGPYDEHDDRGDCQDTQGKGVSGGKGFL